MKNWFVAKKFVFFVLASITAIIVIGVSNVEIGVKSNSKHDVFSIEFEYYGMDSSKIEELITIPLEQKLLGLENLLELTSTTEYGKSVTTAYFKKTKKINDIYFSIRNIVDTLYLTLPKDVQKPRIYTSEGTSKSVLSIACKQNNKQIYLRDFLESTLKKKIEAVNGVSEVLITGGYQKELLVAFNPEKSAASLQNPNNYASAIQDSNSVALGSEFRQKNKNVAIQFDTKIKNIEEIKDLPLMIGESYSKLKFLSDIAFTSKENDEIVRIDGNESISINVKSDSNGNNIRISKEVRKILKEFSAGNIDFKILYDEGEKQLFLIKNVLISLLESLVCVFLIIPFFYKSHRTTFLILTLLVFTCAWTIGILSFAGFSLNQNTISGLVIALGLIVDSALVIAENAEICKKQTEFIASLKRLTPALIFAGLTTVLALIPLFFLDVIVPGSKQVAITIGIMLAVSLVLSILFVSPFIFVGGDERNEFCKFNINSYIKRFYTRFGFRCSSFSVKHKKLTSVIYFILILCPVFIFFAAGKNISFDNSSDILYCSVDYESEVSSSYIDGELERFIKKLSSNKFVTFVRTESRKGSADIEIGIKDKSKEKMASYVSSLSEMLPDGFLYVPEVTSKNSGAKKVKSFQIAFLGDESKLCRSYCEQAAKLLNESPYCSSAVLNFKKVEKEYAFAPDRSELVKNNLSVQSVASTLRWFMFGPVADKWLSDGKEYDIRLVGKNLRKASLETIENLYIPVENSAVRLSSLGKIQLKDSNGKIYRKDGRRCAYITVEIMNLSTDEAMSSIKKSLKSLEFEKGYGYLFSNEVEEFADNYKLIFKMLIISIIGIFMLLTFLTENIKKSMLIISIIPVSLVFPLAIKFIISVPLELGDIVGMIVLSGISVNNAIYIMESEKNLVIFKVREKIKSIFVTSLTTIVGSIPLYFMATDSFSKSLAFFMIFGILNSLFSTVLLFPGVVSSKDTPGHKGSNHAR